MVSLTALGDSASTPAEQESTATSSAQHTASLVPVPSLGTLCLRWACPLQASGIGHFQLVAVLLWTASLIRTDETAPQEMLTD